MSPLAGGARRRHSTAATERKISKHKKNMDHQRRRAAAKTPKASHHRERQKNKQAEQRRQHQNGSPGIKTKFLRWSETSAKIAKFGEKTANKAVLRKAEQKNRRCNRPGDRWPRNCSPDERQRSLKNPTKGPHARKTWGQARKVGSPHPVTPTKPKMGKNRRLVGRKWRSTRTRVTRE